MVFTRTLSLALVYGFAMTAHETEVESSSQARHTKNDPLCSGEPAPWYSRPSTPLFVNSDPQGIVLALRPQQVVKYRTYRK